MRMTFSSSMRRMRARTVPSDTPSSAAMRRLLLRASCWSRSMIGY
jgi:hypothetical protein